MLRLKQPSERHVAQIRGLLGAYLLWHFAVLLPHAGALFGSAGMLPDPTALPSDGTFPNLLALSYLTVPGWFVLAGCAASVSFGLGLLCRPMALVLWFVWATLLNRNPFVDNPSIAYVGWLLLAYAVIPTRRVFPLGGKIDETPWSMPGWLVGAAWLLLGLGYTLSGVDKLTSPSWADGSALSHVLALPLARDTPLRDLLLSLPEPVLRGLTWGGLALQILALPLFILPQLRSWGWLALAVMQVATMALLDCADVALGMLVFHAFVYERGSLPRRPAAPPPPKRSPRVPGFSPGGVGI